VGVWSWWDWCFFFETGANARKRIMSRSRLAVRTIYFVTGQKS
jgi:hypothetical protein